MAVKEGRKISKTNWSCSLVKFYLAIIFFLDAVHRGWFHATDDYLATLATLFCF